MAKGAGKDFLIKVGDGNTPEVFTTIAGMRASASSISNGLIDVTDKDQAQWRSLLAGGIKSMSLTASGVMNDAATMKKLLSAIFSTAGGDIANFQLYSGLGHMFQGSFFITGLDDGGDIGKEETYSLKFESNGVIAYTPAP